MGLLVLLAANSSVLLTEHVLRPPARAAFAFVYKERAPEPQRRPLAWLFGGAAAAQGSTAEFPASDMRALDGLERILRRAGVLNE